MIMAHEEHSQMCSNSSSDDRGVESGGFGRSSKRLKQKRVPQRGLGVAQLEKIRLEEHQYKKDPTSLAPTMLSPYSTVSPTNSLTCFQMQQLPSIVPPNFRPYLSSPSVPLLPPLDLTSPMPAFRSTPSSCMPKINALHPNPVLPLPNSLNVGGGERNYWSGIMVPSHGHGRGHWSKLWNGDDNLGGENKRSDHLGVEFRPNIKLPIESHSPVLPLPSMLQRPEQYDQPVYSSMVNVSTGISSSLSASSSLSSSSVLKFLLEPPSNQNYNSNNYTPLWPEEVKIVGNKRTCPFSSDYPPIPVFHCKLPPGYDNLSISRTNELASCCTDFSANVESQKLPKRQPNQGSFTNGSGGLSGDFLTLAPLSTSSPRLESRYHLRSRNSCPLNRETSNQGCGEELIQPSKPSGLDQPHIFSFLQLHNIVKTGQEDSPRRSYNSESSEAVDLNLKL